MTLSRLLYRRPLGVPWATLLLFAGCVGTTLPMFFSDRYYLILGVGHERADNPHIRWWHTVVSVFVHGGGFPGTTAHLAINSTFLLVLGGLVERTLGAGRLVALSLACLAAEAIALRLAGVHAQGISGVVWSYALFAPALLAHAWRRDRRDPLFPLVALILLVAVLGLVKRWHLLSVAVGLPFFLAWRGTLHANLLRIDSGEPPSVWGPPARSVAVGVAALLCAFTLAMTLGAVLGLVR